MKIKEFSKLKDKKIKPNCLFLFVGVWILVLCKCEFRCYHIDIIKTLFSNIVQLNEAYVNV